MAEHLIISEGDKSEKYELLYRQIDALVENETDTIAVMSNMTAMIQETFNFLWTGFYRVVGEMLVVGPFQGPLACMRIGYGKGVCGKAWQNKETIIVPDVESFPGHIACSSLSKSEIVVPVKSEGDVVAVLDIDSEKYSEFDSVDALWLEKIISLIPF